MLAGLPHGLAHTNCESEESITPPVHIVTRRRRGHIQANSFMSDLAMEEGVGVGLLIVANFSLIYREPPLRKNAEREGGAGAGAGRTNHTVLGLPCLVGTPDHCDCWFGRGDISEVEVAGVPSGRSEYAYKILYNTLCLSGRRKELATIKSAMAAIGDSDKHLATNRETGRQSYLNCNSECIAASATSHGSSVTECTPLLQKCAMGEVSL
ncbi:hypothetical protein J6590_008468 [Homalodisca vitripennis]|nr:hypothetical protein J6590_008468 [Homalodisca vitripennis]